MLIRAATFIKSSPTWQQCPDDERAEVAFIGRSNVGKSSLINMLTERKSLAKVSETPGKTQLINHFLINDLWYLVDLPGYGYAQVPKTIRAKFRAMIENYVLNREQLYCLFILLDARHEPQKIDLEFINWAGESGVPIALVFTKTDKLGKEAWRQNREVYERELLTRWEELPPIFVTSAKKRVGRDELLDFIDSFIHAPSS